MKHRISRYGAAVTIATACLASASTAANAQPEAPAVSLAAHSSSTATRLAYYYAYGKLIHVKPLGTKCGKNPLAKASGPGGVRLSISETKSVSSTHSKDIGLHLKIVSGSVGWDVTKSHSITVSGSKEVSRGKHGTLTAYAKYTGKKFDIEDQWGRVVERNKTAYKPIGVCFKYTEK